MYQTERKKWVPLPYKVFDCRKAFTIKLLSGKTAACGTAFQKETSIFHENLE